MWSSLQKPSETPIIQSMRSSNENKITSRPDNNGNKMLNLHHIDSEGPIAEQSVEESGVSQHRRGLHRLSSIPALDTNRSRRYNSPNKSLNKAFHELKLEKSHFKYNSAGKQIESASGDGSIKNSTARKRRLMLLDDAAGSSINFEKQAQSIGSIAEHSSAMRASGGTKLISY